MTEYKFNCDFYYLHYDKNDKKHGTIYRNVNDNVNDDNNKIEYIYGCNENTKKILTENNTKKITDFFDNFKKEIFDETDTILKENNEYLDKYDFNTLDDEYFKKLSLAYLCEEENYLNLIQIDMEVDIIDIGIVFGFIKTTKFNINNMIIKYKEKDDFILTKINFSTYNEFIKECNENKNNNKLYNNCIKDRLNPRIITSKKKSSKKKSSKKKGGSIEIIKTEQKNLNHETIMHYFKSMPSNMPPVIIEYEDEQYFIVDGNHRVAFHIINNFEYIPVMIIFKNFNNIKKELEEDEELDEEEDKKCIKNQKPIIKCSKRRKLH